MGRAMRAVTGIWMIGITSKMLQTKMKANNVNRNGVQDIPSGPMVCRMIAFCTNSITASPAFCTPDGTRLRPRAAVQKKAKTMTAASHSRSTTLFTAKMPWPNSAGQSVSWPTGGKSRPNTGIRRILSASTSNHWLFTSIY